MTGAGATEGEGEGDARARRLIVMRHAKSSWDSDASSDHARPLTGRGRREARAIAVRLVSMGWIPDRIGCSDAVRAVETLDAVREVLRDRAPPGALPDEALAERDPRAIPTRVTGALYHAGPDGFRDVVAGFEAESHTVLVVGHNPGWEQVVAWLTGTLVPLGTANAVLLTGARAPSWAAALDAPSFQVAAVLRPDRDGR